MRKNKYTFNMPNGEVLTSFPQVDAYYGLTKGVSSVRYHSGWTIEECCKNRRDSKSKHKFILSNGIITYNTRDVDRFLGQKLGTTYKRLLKGWTVEECAKGSKEGTTREKVWKDTEEYLQNNPTYLNHKRVYNLFDIDKYYKLEEGTTLTRLCNGWTIAECIRNAKSKNGMMYTFNMPDGTVLYKCSDIDKYYGLTEGVTLNRLIRGYWTEDECANNVRKTDKSERLNILRCEAHIMLQDYYYTLPTQERVLKLSKIDEFYGLKYDTTLNRLLVGWSMLECVSNMRMKWE